MTDSQRRCNALGCRFRKQWKLLTNIHNVGCVILHQEEATFVIGKKVMHPARRHTKATTHPPFRRKASNIDPGFIVCTFPKAESLGLPSRDVIRSDRHASHHFVQSNHSIGMARNPRSSLSLYRDTVQSRRLRKEALQRGDQLGPKSCSGQLTTWQTCLSNYSGYAHGDFTREVNTLSPHNRGACTFPPEQKDLQSVL